MYGCDVAKEATERPLLANRNVKRKRVNDKQPNNKELTPSRGLQEPPTSQPVLCVTKRIQEKRERLDAHKTTTTFISWGLFENRFVNAHSQPF